MKNLLFGLLISAALVSCGEANDGDPTTDTTTFDRPIPESSAPYGDTSMNMASDPSDMHTGSVNDTTHSGDSTHMH